MTFAQDIWAVGCILLSLLLGQAPFHETTALGTLLSIFKLFGTP
jgi:serine/threonine protein kinase